MYWSALTNPPHFLLQITQRPEGKLVTKGGVGEWLYCQAGGMGMRLGHTYSRNPPVAAIIADDILGCSKAAEQIGQDRSLETVFSTLDGHELGVVMVLMLMLFNQGISM